MGSVLIKILHCDLKFKCGVIGWYTVSAKLEDAGIIIWNSKVLGSFSWNVVAIGEIKIVFGMRKIVDSYISSMVLETISRF